jgi:hypothetical protein
VPDDFRVLVTGARSVTLEGARLVRAKLLLACAPAMAEDLTRTAVTIVQGQCPYGGVDRVAEDWAASYGATNEPHPILSSDNRDGKPRNSRMVDAGAAICLAFPDDQSRGTWDCIRKAANAGIPVRIYPLGARRA